MASRTHGRWNKGEMPEDIRADSLNDAQMTTRWELDRLKDWLCRRRTETRQERERAERRGRKKSRQPAVFEFQHAPISV